MLPVFDNFESIEAPIADGIHQEAAWMSSAASGQAIARIWEGQPGFVVPRRYELLPGFNDLKTNLASRGQDVQVRASGGGLVPQGPGVLNVSLAWPTSPSLKVDTTAIYNALTGAIASALRRIDIHARAEAVEGSFCDGRYNLAVNGRKLVGTAQSWRRINGVNVVLAHAVIVVTAEPAALTELTNAFEQQLGTGTRYRTDALTSVALSWQAAHDEKRPPNDLGQTTRNILTAELRSNAAAVLTVER